MEQVVRAVCEPRITRQEMRPDGGGAMRQMGDAQSVLKPMRCEAWDVVWYRAQKALGFLKECE